MKKLILWWQLKKSGMHPDEYRELDAVARQLKLQDVHLSREAKDDIAEQIGFKPVHIKLRHHVQFASGFALFALLVVAAQFSHSGSPLYALKRGTQNVRAVVQPSYKQELEQERAEEEQVETENDSGDNSGRGSDDSTTSSDGSDRQSDNRHHRRSRDSRQRDREDSSGSGSSNESDGSDDSSSSGSSSGGSSGGSYDDEWWKSDDH